jgi:hypothetical protein
MSVDNARLLEFMAEIDREVRRRIALVAAGGTAMTLLGLKPSTIDVDFTGRSDEIDEFEEALRQVPHGFTVHCWRDGVIFSQMLPDDYVEKSVGIDADLGKIDLRALQPVDVVVTKIGRLDDRDFDDIEACIRGCNLTEVQVTRRAERVEYVGRAENYRINLDAVVARFFR